MCFIDLSFIDLLILLVVKLGGLIMLTLIFAGRISKELQKMGSKE